MWGIFARKSADGSPMHSRACGPYGFGHGPGGFHITTCRARCDSYSAFLAEKDARADFQLSFAAVATIVILRESRWIKRWTERREELIAIRLGPGLTSLVVTNLAIELILAPVALFRFHGTGVYGALANVVAILLTTFFIMPVSVNANNAHQPCVKTAQAARAQEAADQ